MKVSSKRFVKTRSVTYQIPFVKELHQRDRRGFRQLFQIFGFKRLDKCWLCFPSGTVDWAAVPIFLQHSLDSHRETAFFEAFQFAVVEGRVLGLGVNPHCAVCGLSQFDILFQCWDRELAIVCLVTIRTRLNSTEFLNLCICQVNAEDPL